MWKKSFRAGYAFPHAEPYSLFALCYDRVMQSIDYKKWAGYVDQILKRYHCPGNSVLDIACGTGKFLDFLSRHGYSGAGMDISSSMLERARELYTSNNSLEFFQGDIRTISVSRQYDAVICLHDSMNYLTSYEDISDVLHSVYSTLLPRGLFIFDLCTRFSILRNFSGQVFSEDTAEYAYIWRNRYSRFTGKARVTIDFLIKSEPAQCGRERHEQRIFSIRAVKKLIAQDQRYDLLGCFDDFSQQPAGRRTETATFVLRRRA